MTDPANLTDIGMQLQSVRYMLYVQLNPDAVVAHFATISYTRQIEFCLPSIWLSIDRPHHERLISPEIA